MEKGEVFKLLEQIRDPEIPVLSIVDLGIITDVSGGEKHIVVELTPTFTGCPAIDMIKAEIKDILCQNGFEEVTVNVSFRETWSSDKISEKGKDALRKFGISPPPSGTLFHDIGILEQAVCPRCSGISTELRSPFGSTLCRSIHYCYTCKESFEQFKPV